MAKREKIQEKKRAEVFITNSGKIFTAEELKKYEVPQSKQVEEVKWGNEVITPPYDLNRLMEWLHYSVAHSSCVRVKVQDTVGIGWKVKDRPGMKGTEAEKGILETFFKRVNDDEGLTGLAKKVMLDYEGCGNGYFEVVRGLKEEEAVKALYHVNATTIRLSIDKEKWVQQVGIKKVYFKKWGDTRIMNKDTGQFIGQVSPEKAANELIQIKCYTHKSPYYGLPEWMAGLFPMFGEQKEKEYNLEFFTSYGVPAYAVILEGIELTEDVKREVQKYFEVELKGNPHRTLILGSPQGGTYRFERLSVDQKEASFRVYRRDNRDDVLTAHHVPPYRAGIVERGQLGGSVAEDVDRIYLDSVINPRQEEVCWILNELIILEGFGIETMIVDFDDVDIRDKRAQAEIDSLYFNMGALTANDILVAQGRQPYEGGDMYYLPANLVPIGVAEKKLGEPDGSVGEKDTGDGGQDLPLSAQDYHGKKKSGKAK